MRHDPSFGGPLGEREPPFTDAEAREILARAAEREHAVSTGVPASHLREAALEAGISAAAFDGAVAELRATPVRRQNRRRGILALAVGLAVLVGAGTTALQRRVAPAAPAAPALPTPLLPAGDPAAAAPGSGVPGRSMASACAAPAGVPAERLRTLARDLYPEVLTSQSRQGSLVVALLFDASCNLKAHVLTRRGAGDGAVDAILASVFPAATTDALQLSGIADVGPWTFEKQAPWIMWGVERGPR